MKFYKVRNWISKLYFSYHCKNILSTPPLKPKGDRLLIVSMVCHLDVIMYLIAIKSLYFYLKKGQIIIINDGTLTSKDISLLKHHVSPIQIINTEDIDTGKCPHGGCWERLVFIADCIKENYVIQLDSDTVTFNSIPEVIDCVGKNISFILGTMNSQKIESIENVYKKMAMVNGNHVQTVAEKNFDKLSNYSKFKYVRGCAAFAGFARNSFSRLDIENFSQQMQKNIGTKWLEWGSEQVTSNFIIANSSPSIVLPYPKYAGFRPWRSFENSSFLHFVGTYRFKKGIYMKLAKEIIKKLREG